MKLIALAIMVLGGLTLPATGSTQETVFTPFVLEQTVDRLPPGPLYWQLQTFGTRAEAEAAAGPTGQVGEAEGTVWLFTLGPRGGAPAGGTLVDEIGPLEVPAAEAYLLRIGYSITEPRVIAGGGPPVHTHPGTEAFYILAGEQTVWIPGQEVRTGAGQSLVGAPAETPMIVVSSGTEARRSFTLFVVDATKPFTSPAVFPAAP